MFNSSILTHCIFMASAKSMKTTTVSFLFQPKDFPNKQVLYEDSPPEKIKVGEDRGMGAKIGLEGPGGKI